MPRTCVCNLCGNAHQVGTPDPTPPAGFFFRIGQGLGVLVLLALAVALARAIIWLATF